MSYPRLMMPRAMGSMGLAACFGLGQSAQINVHTHGNDSIHRQKWAYWP